MRTARTGRLNSGSLSRSEPTVVFWSGTGSRRHGAQDQDLDCTKDAAYLERIRAVTSSDIMAQASGPAPVASCINLKTHLGSTTSSRRRRRQLSVAARP